MKRKKIVKIRKGFTLIELLAVILILGIIALIAIPIVTSIITDAREQALLNNVDAIIDNVKLNRSKELLDNNYQIFSISEGNLYDSFGEVIDTIADKTLSGMGIVYDDESAELALNNGEKCIMRAKAANINVLSDYDETCKLDYELPVMKSWTWDTANDDFRSSKYKSSIISLTFNIDNLVPSNAYESWDISANQDGSVVAYVVETKEGTNQYNLYIGGKFGVQATSLMMFLDCFYGIKKIDFTNLDTSKVADMRYMFRYCRNLKEVDLSSLDLSNAKYMDVMFSNSAIAKVSFGDNEISNVVTTTYMFTNCSALENLDLSNFNTSNVTNMTGMFQGTSSITEILVGEGWTTEKATTTDMFIDSNITSVTLK